MTELRLLPSARADVDFSAPGPVVWGALCSPVNGCLDDCVLKDTGGNLIQLTQLIRWGQ